MKATISFACVLTVVAVHFSLVKADESSIDNRMNQTDHAADVTKPNNDAGISRAPKDAATVDSGSSESAKASALFEQLDTNKNGHIDPNEASKSAILKSNMDAIDKNHDGKVSRDEWINYKPKDQ